MIASAERNEKLVIADSDGNVLHVPAKDLFKTLPGSRTYLILPFLFNQNNDQNPLFCKMPSPIIEDKTFTKATAETLSGYNNTFENCSFINSDLSYADLSSVTFINCSFQGCNLTLIRLSDTGLQDIHFKDCKLSGADFSKSRDFFV